MNYFEKVVKLCRVGKFILKLPNRFDLYLISALFILFIFNLEEINAASYELKSDQRSTGSTKIRFDKLSIEDGLKDQYVWDIIQDSKGLMWFATTTALSTYDGKRISTFINRGPGRISKSLWSIMEDSSGTVWIGTYGNGLDKFDRKTGTFDNFNLQHLDPDGNNGVNQIKFIYESPRQKGILWLGTYSGMIRFETGKGAFRRYAYDPQNPMGLPGNVIHCIYEDRSGDLWISTKQGLCRMKWESRFSPAKKLELEIFRHDPLISGSISSNAVYTITEDSSGYLWIGTDKGLNRMEKRTGLFACYKHNKNDPLSISHNSVYSILVDKDGDIWIGTLGGGLNKLKHENFKSPVFSRYVSDFEDDSSLSHDWIRKIYQDKSGVIWIATFGGGVNKIHSIPFRSFYKKDGSSSLRGRDIHSLWGKSDGQETTLLLAYRSEGLSQIIMGNNKIRSVRNFGHDPEDNQSLSGDMVRAIFQDRTDPDVFWIGTYKDGLNRLDTKSGTSTRYFQEDKNHSNYSSPSVFSLFISPYNPRILWIGTNQGLFILNLNLKKRTEPKKIILGSFGNKVPLSNQISFIRESTSQPGVLWVGQSEAGLVKLILAGNHTGPSKTEGKMDGFPQIEKIVHYRHQVQNPNSLMDDRVLSIHEANDGVLWIGTGSGLNKLVLNKDGDSNPDHISFTGYDKADGLPDSEIKGVLQDEMGNIWVSSFLGLSRFNPQTKTFSNFSKKDGLVSNQFTRGTAVKTSDGKLYFGGINGLVYFDPADFKDVTVPPGILITDFRLFNKSVPVATDGKKDRFYLKANISELEEITLPFNKNYFSFNFAVTDYKDPDKNKFAYKIEGIDSDWIFTQNGYSATYTNVSPGDYTLRVKGANANGVWNGEGKTLKIKIRPPWYLTWLAYILYFLTFSGIIFGVLRYEINRRSHKLNAELKNMEAEKLQEIDRAKSHFFANISHEFRTPLTLILGKIENELLFDNQKRDSKNMEIVHRNVMQLQSMINQILDLSKFEDGRRDLDLSEQNIVLFLSRICGVFESLATMRKITILFESSEEKIPLFFDSGKMERIIYNILSNALKFTQAGGKVVIKVERDIENKTPVDKGNVIISITDTGIGIPAAKLPHVFDRFYQGDETSTRKYEGTGIGLALVMELVQAHKGSISVKSEIDSGTSFIITMPSGSDHLSPEQILKIKRMEDTDPELSEYLPDLIKAELQRSEDNILEKKRSPDMNKNSSGHSVLIVEDNRDMRSFIADGLKPEYLVLEVEDGNAGFTKAKEQIPDLIITDVMMPGIDGYEMTRLLRDDRLTCHIPIIMLTAKAAEEDKYTGLESGVDAYLTKPFSSRELQIRVRKLIELRSLQQKQSESMAILNPENLEISSMDEAFLKSVNDFISKNIDNSDLNIEDIASHIYIGSRQFQRKLKALTGMSPKHYISKIRLHRAKELLEKNADTVSRITFLVGYKEFSTFSRAFKVEFGKSPSEFKSK